MPYIAFELDALKHVPDAARSAGLPEADLAYGLLRLWNYCWSKKTDHVSAAHLTGFFGGDPTRVASAMGAFDFLEADLEGFRVRGAARYLRISEGRSKGGKAASKNLVPGAFHKQKAKPEAEPEPNPSRTHPSAEAEQPHGLTIGTPSGFHRRSTIEHRITKEDLPTTTEILSSSVLKQPKTAAVVEHFPSVVPDPDEADRQLRGDENGEFPPTGLGFCGWWNKARVLEGMTKEIFNVSEVAQWADRCIAEVGEEKFWRAADAYIRDKFWRKKGCPLILFRSDQVWRIRANEAAS